jgi:mRNA interferase MazF
MRRGDLVTVVMSGDFGKPRPALVIQSDHFDATATVAVLLISSTLVDAPLIRLAVEPTRRMACASHRR